MSYNDLLTILLYDDVYDKLKQNEEEIFSLIPELKVCKGFEQNSKWHIYDVYEHILHVVSGIETNIYLRVSALFHDIGKPFVYKEDLDRTRHFYNHWYKSIEIFKKYKDNFNLSSEEINLICNLIFYHDVNLEKMNINDIEKMINIIGKANIILLFSLKRSDLLAQSPDYHYLMVNINNQEERILKKILLMR